MALPTIVSVAEDSISAIGRELREASYSCGATRLETIVRMVLPAAHSGIIAAVVLGMMRAIGETMVVWMASGNATQIPASLVGPVAVGADHDRHASPARWAKRRGLHPSQGLFTVGVLLLVLTLPLERRQRVLPRPGEESGGEEVDERDLPRIVGPGLHSPDGLSIVLLTLVLVAMLGPMLYRGSSAVWFDGTIEFRKMQRDLFNRGDEELSMPKSPRRRGPPEGLRDNRRFKKGIDTESLTDEVR